MNALSLKVEQERWCQDACFYLGPVVMAPDEVWIRASPHAAVLVGLLLGYHNRSGPSTLMKKKVMKKAFSVDFHASCHKAKTILEYWEEQTSKRSLDRLHLPLTNFQNSSVNCFPPNT